MKKQGTKKFGSSPFDKKGGKLGKYISFEEEDDFDNSFGMSESVVSDDNEQANEIDSQMIK